MLNLALVRIGHADGEFPDAPGSGKTIRGSLRPFRWSAVSARQDKVIDQSGTEIPCGAPED